MLWVALVAVGRLLPAGLVRGSYRPRTNARVERRRATATTTRIPLTQTILQLQLSGASVLSRHPSPIPGLQQSSCKSVLGKRI